MPQVSRRSLSRNVQDKMFKIFFESLAQLSNPSDIQKLVLDLLGPVEQTMLAKRLAIALLLIKGYQYETIKDILKVSQGTISKINMILNLKGEGYNMTVKRILRKQKIENLFNLIEDATIQILPESSVKRAMKREKRRTRKPNTSLG